MHSCRKETAGACRDGPKGMHSCTEGTTQGPQAAAKTPRGTHSPAPVRYAEALSTQARAFRLLG